MRNFITGILFFLLVGCATKNQPIYLPIPMVTNTKHIAFNKIPDLPKNSSRNDFIKWCVVNNKILTAELNSCQLILTGEDN